MKRDRTKTQDSFGSPPQLQPTSHHQKLSRDLLANINSLPDLQSPFKASPQRQRIRQSLHSEIEAVKSFPNLFQGCNYIKIDSEAVLKYQKSLGRSREANYQGEKNQLIRFCRSPKAPETFKQPKSPKFSRKTVRLLSPTTAKQISALGTLSGQSTSLEAEYFRMEGLLAEKQQKISQLQQKLKSINPERLYQQIKEKDEQIAQFKALLEEKDKQIESLKTLFDLASEEKVQMSEKLDQIISDNKLFNDCSQFNFEFDVTTTAQQIASIQDLQDEIHIKNREIFEIGRAMDQLKMKHHFLQLRHADQLKRCNQDWEKKLRNSQNRVKQMRDKMIEWKKEYWQKLEEIQANRPIEKKTPREHSLGESLFNLSASLDRSLLVCPNMEESSREFSRKI